MTPLDEIKAEIVAKLLETGTDGDGYILYISNKKWKLAAVELGIKTRGAITGRQLRFTIGKVEVVNSPGRKKFAWSKSFDWEQADRVMRAVYLPSIKALLNKQ